jgi:hypothetical protein
MSTHEGSFCPNIVETLATVRTLLSGIRGILGVDDAIGQPVKPHHPNRKLYWAAAFAAEKRFAVMALIAAWQEVMHLLPPVLVEIDEGDFYRLQMRRILADIEHALFCLTNEDPIENGHRYFALKAAESAWNRTAWAMHLVADVYGDNKPLTIGNGKRGIARK